MYEKLKERVQPFLNKWLNSTKEKITKKRTYEVIELIEEDLGSLELWELRHDRYKEQQKQIEELQEGITELETKRDYLDADKNSEMVLHLNTEISKIRAEIEFYEVILNNRNQEETEIFEKISEELRGILFPLEV